MNKYSNAFFIDNPCVLRMNSGMDTRHIRHFLALVDSGSFARACEIVHLSQPALSRSIKQLEHQFGATLFERGRFGAILTAHGRAALPHVRGLLAAAESLRSRDRGTQYRDRSVSRAVTIGPGFCQIRGTVSGYSSEHPHG